MPKSKRSKVVHTSQVEKKGKDLSIKLFASIQESADLYRHCVVFDVNNMRNTYLKEVRSQLAADSRLFFGKTKVMAKALGSSAEDEHLPGLHKLTPYMTGNVGLLFSNKELQDIIDYCADYVQTDFARAGIEASRTFIVPEGVVYSRGGEIPIAEDVPVPHSLEPTLRRWGMPVRLSKGKITLDAPFTVCTEGEELNSNQTALLKHFGIVMADFKILPKAYWTSTSQDVVELDSPVE